MAAAKCATPSELRKAISPLESELLTPALVVDLDAMEHNIKAIVRRVGDPRRWRPHVKTNKQAQVIRSLMDRRVTSFKCATVDELALVLDTAERVHPEGHVDALLAYPSTRAACRTVVQLIHDYEGGTVRLLADSPEHFAALSDWLGDAGASRPVDVMLDVDVGMGRTGASPPRWQAASADLAKGRTLRIVGLHGYDGHLAWDQRAEAHAGYDKLVELAAAFPDKAMRFVVTSGTHSFVHALEHAKLGGGGWRHQVSPGTIVLSDLRSKEPAEDLGLKQAAFVATRVISRPGDDRVTLDAGSKAIAPDRRAPTCAILDWPGLEPLTPSEEHLPVEVTQGERPALGELLWLIPDHVCTTVNMHRNVIYVRGSKFVRRGTVEAQGRTLLTRDRRP